MNRRNFSFSKKPHKKIKSINIDFNVWGRCTRLLLLFGTFLFFYGNVMGQQSCADAPAGSSFIPGGMSIPMDGTTAPYIPVPTADCPILDKDDYEDIRGFMPGCTQMGCPVSLDPPVLNMPTITCPVKSISYQITVPSVNTYVQYWNNCLLATPYWPSPKAAAQGFINQMFCNTDSRGLPAAPIPAPAAGVANFLPESWTEVEGLVTGLAPPGLSNCDFRTKDAADVNQPRTSPEIVQIDFWMLVPASVPTIGFQLGGESADAGAFYVGPDLNNMCVTADTHDPVFNSNIMDDNFGVQTAYYTIPPEAKQVCGGKVVRIRLYISDINAIFTVTPQLNVGGGFQDLVSLPNVTIIPATSGDDNVIPDFPLAAVTKGIKDANGDIFSLDGEWLPTACEAAEEEDFFPEGPINLGVKCIADPAIAIDLDATYNSCAGTAAFTYSLAAPVPPGVILTGSNLSINTPTPGTYAINVRASGPGLGPAGDVIEPCIYEFVLDYGIIDCTSCPADDIMPSNSGPICPGGTVNLFAGILSGGTNPYNYNWAGPAGFTSNQVNPLTTPPSAVGSYNYALTITDNTGMVCTDGAITTVIVNPLPTCSITGPPMNMENTQDVVYSGPAGMSIYSWSVIAGDAAIDGVNNAQDVRIDFGTANSTLQLTITDANGCMATCTISVIVSDCTLTCSINGLSMTLENTQDVAYSGTMGMSTYAWSVITGDALIDGASNTQNVNIDFGTMNSTLQLVVTDSDGCMATCTIPVIVTNCTLTCSINGSATTLENTQDVAYSGPTGMSSYTWSVIAGDATIDGVSNTQNVNIDFGISSSTLQLVVTDSDGCMATCTFPVTVINCIPTCSINGPAMTLENTQNVGYSGLIGMSSYAWSIIAGDATIDGVSNTQSVSINFGTMNSTLQLVVTDSDGCMSTCTIPVTVVNCMLTCSITGSSLNIENTQDVAYSGPMGMSTYSWSVIAGDASVDGASNTQNISIDFGTMNSTLQLVITDSDGCGAVCMVNVTVIEPPVYTWTFLDPCNCSNPNNISLGDGTFLVADFIRVDASQYTNPTVTLAEADANFLDATGTPIPAASATFMDQGGGIYLLPFYTLANLPATFTIDLDGDQQTGTSSTNCSCDETPIPTMSQWGLMIYGLLILNLGLILIKGIKKTPLSMKE